VTLPSFAHEPGAGAPGPWPSLEDLRVWLRISDRSEDSFLESVLVGTINAVEERCGQFWPDGEVPATVARAAVMHAGRVYKRRDSLDGTIGMPDMGMLRVGRFDADIDGMLYPHRRVRLA
jgi:hypothetical protein